MDAEEHFEYDTMGELAELAENRELNRAME